MAADYTGGTWFVPLENCSDASSVVAAICTELQLKLNPGDPATELAALLSLRGPALLLLDNAETCVEGVRVVLNSLHASGARCVVTSQLAVNAPGELRLEVKPLATPGARARDVSPERVVVFGSPARALSEYAAANGYSLVAVGRRGKGIAKALLGSTASALARDERTVALIV